MSKVFSGQNTLGTFPKHPLTFYQAWLYLGMRSPFFFAVFFAIS